MRELLVFDNSHLAPSAEPRKRPRQERSRRMVERILDAAARIFEERGYRATTTNDVAEAAHVSVGSLYQYFANKDALLVGLAERHLDEATPRLAELDAHLRRDPPDADRLCLILVRAAAELNHSDRLHHLLWSAPRTQALLARLTALEDAMTDMVVWHLLRLGHDPGVAHVRARLLVTTVEACTHEVVAGADRDRAIEELVRLCAGYVRRA
jgi:AcrR family transcriptional regulator